MSLSLAQAMRISVIGLSLKLTKNAADVGNVINNDHHGYYGASCRDDERRSPVLCLREVFVWLLQGRARDACGGVISHILLIQA